MSHIHWTAKCKNIGLMCDRWGLLYDCLKSFITDTWNYSVKIKIIKSKSVFKCVQTTQTFSLLLHSIKNPVDILEVYVWTCLHMDCTCTTQACTWLDCVLKEGLISPIQYASIKVDSKATPLLRNSQKVLQDYFSILWPSFATASLSPLSHDVTHIKASCYFTHH